MKTLLLLDHDGDQIEFDRQPTGVRVDILNKSKSSLTVGVVLLNNRQVKMIRDWFIEAATTPKRK